MVFTVATAQAYSVVGEQALYTSQSDGALITQVVGNQILEWRLPRDGWEQIRLLICLLMASQQDRSRSRS